MQSALRLAVVAAVAALLSVEVAAGKQAVAPAPKAPEAAQAPDKPQVFRAGVEIVSLNVTVTDPQGRYVTDVGQG
jgi:hypothetical protein